MGTIHASPACNLPLTYVVAVVDPTTIICTGTGNFRPRSLSFGFLVVQRVASLLYSALLERFLLDLFRRLLSATAALGLLVGGTAA